MYQRVRISIMALFFIVLLLGIANAAQVTVVTPNNGENLVSGKVYDALIECCPVSFCTPHSGPLIGTKGLMKKK